MSLTSLQLVTGQDQLVAEWIIALIPEAEQFPHHVTAIGVARDDELVGGALYTNYRTFKAGGADIHVWCAGHGWLSRRIIGVLLGYPLYQLGCHRLTSIVRRRNKPSRRLLEGLGFKLEGVQRAGFGLRGGDALIYGLLKTENRWPFPEEERRT